MLKECEPTEQEKAEAAAAARAAELLKQQQAGKDVTREAVELGKQIKDNRSGGSGSSSGS